MAEETEGPESGPESIGVAGDPAAVTLALGGASREKADAFLDDQRSLINVQKHHLLKQFSLALLEKRLGILLRMATVLVGMAILTGLSFLIWDASHAEGLLIEPFSVPPDMVARGVTGQAVASEVSDRIGELNGQISSQRAPKTFVNDWSASDIKVEIPETGISFSELEHFLRGKLGHDVHVSGEVIRNVGGLKLTARASGAGASTVTGPESDLDALVQALAEKVFHLTQPYRYGVYLAGHGRQGEALAAMEDLARNGTPEDNPWALNLVAQLSQDLLGRDVAFARFRGAMKTDPQNLLAESNYARMETELGMAESAVRDWRIQQILIASTASEIIRANNVPVLAAEGRSYIAAAFGDFRPAMSDSAKIISFNLPGHNTVSPDLARIQLGEHEVSAARATMADPVFAAILKGTGEMTNLVARMMIDQAAEDWKGALQESGKADALTVTYPGMRSFIPAMVTPLAAVAEARLHRFERANSDIAATPGDCYPCLIARAQIAQLQSQNARADFWFTRAVADAPSIPFAEYEWGRVMLTRGQTDAAMAEFKLANQKGPHFADPLEGWGEALMAKNQSHLALAKFAEAEKYAPNWGRLHLKWGEALVYAGKKDEAKAQFTRAVQLDLTPAEKFELVQEKT